MKELENLIEDMRHSEPKQMKEYLFIDKIKNETYSFNTDEAREKFIFAYISHYYYNDNWIIEVSEDRKELSVKLIEKSK